jgi:hypothetical protein
MPMPAMLLSVLGGVSKFIHGSLRGLPRRVQGDPQSPSPGMIGCQKLRIQQGGSQGQNGGRQDGDIPAALPDRDDLRDTVNGIAELATIPINQGADKG